MTLAKSESDSELACIARLVATRAGLSFPESRWAIAEAAIRRAKQSSGAPSLSAYLALLESSAQEFEQLINQLTVGETYFFRDPAQFDFIAREVLPPAAERDGRIRAWSAGCATGEEPYSIAILLDQLGHLQHAAVYGTDIAPARLERAREALYSPWSLRGCPEEIVSAYFTKVARGYRLEPRVRRAVAFSELNLAETDLPAIRSDLRDLDLVLCRNVLIYLERDTIVRVAERLLNALHPDGWLLLGASDPAIQELVPCRVEVTEAGLAYQRARPRPARAESESPPLERRTQGEAAPGTANGEEWRAAASRKPRKRRQRSSPPGPRRNTPARSRPSAATYRWSEAAEQAASISELRTLLNQRRLEGAETAFAAALQRHPVSAEIAYLHAVLLSELGKHSEAVRAARGALYLDRGLPVAHLALSRALERTGDQAGAERALANAEAALAALPEDAVVPGGDGERASELLDLVRASRRLLRSGPS